MQSLYNCFFVSLLSLIRPPPPKKKKRKKLGWSAGVRWKKRVGGERWMKSNIRLKRLFLLLFVQPTGLDSVATALLQIRGPSSANHHLVSTLRPAFSACLTSRSCDQLKHINRIIQLGLKRLLKCFSNLCMNSCLFLPYHSASACE